MATTIFSKDLPNSLISERQFNPKMSNIEKKEEFCEKIISNLSNSTEEIMEKKEHVVIKKSEIANSPWVLLFGWAGCQDRYLTKYSQIYEKKK
uniref:Uncharacterized protein n=1 Tax=Panagrolaimus sp. JU765 TaxID=591449 RepID=A0AC34PY94_9BILA